MNKDILKMSNIEIISEIASDWWTKMIVDPKMDNGDKSESGVICNMLAKLATTNIEEENLIKFKNKLNELVKINLNKFDKLFLDVDYSPSGLLLEAAEYADISTNNFPIKTTMTIGFDCVRVRYGYGAPNGILYATEDYYIRQLNEAKETLEYYSNKPKEEFYSFNKEDVIEEQKEYVKRAKEELDTFNKLYKEKGMFIYESC